MSDQIERIKERLEQIQDILSKEKRDIYRYNIIHRINEAAENFREKIKDKTGIDVTLTYKKLLGKIKGDPFAGIEAQEVEYYGVNKGEKKRLIRKEINKDKVYKKQKLLRLVAAAVLLFSLYRLSSLIVTDTIMFYSLIYITLSMILPIVLCFIYLISIRSIGRKRIDIDYKKNELLILDLDLLFISFNLKKQKNIEKTEMWVYYDTITRMLYNEQESIIYIWVPKDNKKNCIIVNDEQLSTSNEFINDYYIKIYLYYKKKDSLIKELEERSGIKIEKP